MFLSLLLIASYLSCLCLSQCINTHVHIILYYMLVDCDSCCCGWCDLVGNA